MRTGAQLLIDSLIDVGVETLFGIPGGVVPCLKKGDLLLSNREDIPKVLKKGDMAFDEGASVLEKAPVNSPIGHIDEPDHHEAQRQQIRQ